MEWTELKFAVKTEHTDLAAAIANMVSDGGIMIEDYSDMEQTLESMGWQGYISDQLLNKDRSVSVIHIFLPPDSDPDGAQEFIQQKLEASGVEAAFSRDISEDQDWATAWKRFYHPFKVGEKLAVRPSWEPYSPAPGEVVLTLDPGMAFGTGEHETTYLCLQQLERLVQPGWRVLDMGCGSGILSIAALLLGAAGATGVDIDPVAVRTARENACLNGIDPSRYRLLTGNASSDEGVRREIGGGYQLITANIVADVLIAQAGLYLDCLAPGGLLVASGIIGERALEVQRALEEAGFLLQQRLEKRSWVALRMKKPE